MFLNSFKNWILLTTFSKPQKGRGVYLSSIFKSQLDLREAFTRKKTEIVWSFAKPGRGVPPNQTPKRFPAFSVEKKGNCTKGLPPLW